MSVIAKRILLRLDPARPHDGALTRAIRLAKAFHAELAARMIADTRLASAVAIKGLDLERQLRRAESSLRRELTGLGERESATWSLEVVHCAGILARECSMESDDLVAIELPRIELSMPDLRDEIESALAHASGVILFPAMTRPTHGPVAALVRDRKRATHLIEQADRIAETLEVPLQVVEHDGAPSSKGERRETADIATAVRRLDAVLAVADASDPMVAAFIARPRYLREIATPLLLLKSA